MELDVKLSKKNIESIINGECVEYSFGSIPTPFPNTHLKLMIRNTICKKCGRDYQIYGSDGICDECAVDEKLC